MKQTQEYSKAQENMKPGVITAEGFLGTDHRPLADIIEADEEALNKLQIDTSQMAEKMRFLLEAGKKGLGEPVTIENTWLVRVDETRGYLPSPFGEDGIYRKVNAEVELLEQGKPTGKQVVYNELIIHLIEKYHFFQGHGSPFRIDPSLAKEVLKL